MVSIEKEKTWMNTHYTRTYMCIVSRVKEGVDRLFD